MNQNIKSSVNNCTEQNLNNYQEEVCSGEKIDDVSDEERLSALISRKRDWLLSKKIRLTDDQFVYLAKHRRIRISKMEVLSCEMDELRILQSRF
ncbi:hypothetical protein [Gallibacterium anatis]|uniref:Uncharacterized protein n=1 Tax=Gallibacterium anatis TaxID=750 RepID=A0A377H5C7_9PAST|nr:hypothetical protein [Gallibacterium anatis]KGQ24273.1 hypothetical protein JP27_09850 [Gallibacterium anatis]KGQ28237.1 hypothetical protein JP31_02470 [Gallibacterium anatis]KGQ52658.1 hypothetical protein IE01_11735 [Gallibacterium anatis DSM 16844 = F 149]WIM82837.1 hypothetical protein QP019_04090 [Gallibacterium anatis]STO37701.1 Uncharacterised protein [Gallibacterium anatis]